MSDHGGVTRSATLSSIPARLSQPGVTIDHPEVANLPSAG